MGSMLRLLLVVTILGVKGIVNVFPDAPVLVGFTSVSAFASVCCALSRVSFAHDCAHSESCCRGSMLRLLVPRLLVLRLLVLLVPRLLVVVGSCFAGFTLTGFTLTGLALAGLASYEVSISFAIRRHLPAAFLK